MPAPAPPALGAALVNATRREAAELVVPPDLPLDDLTDGVLGWRDAKSPLRGYLLARRDGALVGLVLRAADSPGSRRVNAMCDLCREARKGDEVTLFTARRAGQRGRDHNTVGRYLCVDLTCVEQPLSPGLDARFDLLLAAVQHG